MIIINIKAFLSIESAELVLKRFTVLIGPQAQGKSIIAKLLYFFEESTQIYLQEYVPGDKSLATIKKERIIRFEQLFPKYTWGTSAFAITFEHNGLQLSVTRSGGRTNNPATLQISHPFQVILEGLFKTFKQAYESDERRSRTPALARRRALSKAIEAPALPKSLLAEPMFIPASRSFFANIEKNIFTLISSKFELDPFMAEFGEILNRTRRQRLYSQDVRTRLRRSRTLQPIREIAWRDIVQGDYVYDGEEETIESRGRTVKLSNSSSGQQEVIPLLMMLDRPDEISGMLGSEVGDGSSYFIEEPEAHLFPKAQRSVASIMTKAMNRDSGSRMIFTTHSPYMLSAINNLALAGRLWSDVPSVQRKLEKIVPVQTMIPKGELCAYKVVDGTVTNIVDPDTGLVNGYLVDEVSQEFAEQFTELIEMLPSVN